MGTSSSYGGPTGSNPLLPPWADPLPPEYPLPEPLLKGPLPPLLPPFPLPDGDNQNDGRDGGDTISCPGPTPLRPTLPDTAPTATPTASPPPPPSWQGTKRSLTNYAKSRTLGPGAKPRAVVGKFVRSRGGSRMAAHTARAGRTVTVGIGGFLSDVRTRGFTEAVRGLIGQDLVGRDPMGALAAIIDAIAPDGALRDESAARLAAIETFAELADRYDVRGQGIEALGGVTEADAREMIALSVSTFINAQFQEELILRVESGNYSESEANRIATEIRGFIVEETRLKLDTQNALTLDFKSAAGRELTRQLYQDAFSFLETSP